MLIFLLMDHPGVLGWLRHCQECMPFRWICYSSYTDTLLCSILVIYPCVCHLYLEGPAHYMHASLSPKQVGIECAPKITIPQFSYLLTGNKSELFIYWSKINMLTRH